MLLRKFILGLTTVYVSVLVCGAADESIEVPAKPEPVLMPSFTATLKNGETIGIEQIRRAHLSSGTNQFAFVVPEGFRMDASNPERVVLADSNYNFFLSVRIVVPGRFRDAQTDLCRDLLLKQHPGARISDEFSQSAANRSGPAFDAQWDAVGGTVQSARVAFIPTSIGILEFSLLSRPDKFAQGKYYLNFLLLTFRSNEGGTLELPVFSDKS